jgi:hypothetical protein
MKMQRWQPFVQPSFAAAAEFRMKLLLPSATAAANAATAAPGAAPAARAKRAAAKKDLVTTGPLAQPGPAFDVAGQPQDEENVLEAADAAGDIEAGAAAGAEPDAGGWMGADQFGADDDGGDYGDGGGGGGVLFAFDDAGAADGAHAAPFDSAHFAPPTSRCGLWHYGSRQLGVSSCARYQHQQHRL